DFTDTDTWFTQIPGEDRAAIPPVPILYILNNASDILAYRCFHRDAFESGSNCSDMIIPQPLPAKGHSRVSPPPSLPPPTIPLTNKLIPSISLKSPPPPLLPPPSSSSSTSSISNIINNNIINNNNVDN